MAKFLQLKHTTLGLDQPEYKFYFYEGEVNVHYGVIDLPLDPNFEHWALRAWLKGYRLDPETNELIERDEVIRRLNEAAVTPEPEKAPESTPSAGDKVEGTTSRRQPARRNGVRSRQSTRK